MFKMFYSFSARHYFDKKVRVNFKRIFTTRGAILLFILLLYSKLFYVNNKLGNFDERTAVSGNRKSTIFFGPPKSDY